MRHFNSIVIGKGIEEIEISDNKGSCSIGAYDGDRYIGEMVLDTDLLENISKLEKENAKLREALEFYAEQSQWRTNDPYGIFFKDRGEKAREALGE